MIRIENIQNQVALREALGRMKLDSTSSFTTFSHVLNNLMFSQTIQDIKLISDKATMVFNNPNDSNYNIIAKTIQGPPGPVTSLQQGTNVVITGSGTSLDPYIINSTGSGGGGGVAYNINQPSHGLSQNQIVRLSGLSYVPAFCTTEDDAEVAGIVVSVTDADNFILGVAGIYNTFAGLSAGTWYFLSEVPGEITPTEPTALGYVTKPVILAKSATEGEFFNMRGEVIVDPFSFGVVKYKWHITKDYYEDDLVFYKGNYYLCLQAQSGKQPNINPEFWKIQLGSSSGYPLWDQNISYIPDDYVVYNGNCYQCINSNTGIQPDVDVLYNGPYGQSWKQVLNTSFPKMFCSNGRDGYVSYSTFLQRAGYLGINYGGGGYLAPIIKARTMSQIGDRIKFSFSGYGDRDDAYRFGIYYGPDADLNNIPGCSIFDSSFDYNTNDCYLISDPITNLVYWKVEGEITYLTDSVRINSSVELLPAIRKNVQQSRFYVNQVLEHDPTQDNFLYLYHACDSRTIYLMRGNIEFIETGI